MEPSSFKSHFFTANICDINYSFRILKMLDSVFIYIGTSEKENLDEIGIAMSMKKGEIVGTTALGQQLGCDSKELALKLCKRLKKQVYISCNASSDRMIRPLIEKHLAEEIKRCPEYF